jgi:hypothetical protein
MSFILILWYSRAGARVEGDRETKVMTTIKEPERITLAEGLKLLEPHVTTEEARARLTQAFSPTVGRGESRPTTANVMRLPVVGCGA